MGGLNRGILNISVYLTTKKGREERDDIRSFVCYHYKTQLQFYKNIFDAGTASFGVTIIENVC